MWLAASGAAAQTPGGASPSPEAAAAYASAAALQDRGLYDLAGKEWEALLADHPDDPLGPRARYNLGVCRFQQGRFDEAATSFELITDDKDAGALAESAWWSLGLSRFNVATSLPPGQPSSNAAYRAAVAALDTLLQRHPQSGDAGKAHYYRAESLAALGEFGRAADGYRASLQAESAAPLHGASRLGLASAEMELGQPDQAEATLNTLIAARPTAEVAGEAYALRGEARLAAGRPADAAEDFEQASRQAGYAAADAAAERLAFALYSSGRHADAASAYQQLASRFPESPLASGATLAAGKCLLLADSPGEAAVLLGERWRANPTAANTETAHWLVQALVAAGQGGETARVARQAMAVNPPPQWATPITLALADTLAGEPSSQAEALSLYRQLAADQSSETGQRAAYLAAHTAFDLGQNELALRLAGAFVERLPRHALANEARLVTAESAARLGRNADAIDHYQRLVDSVPVDARSAKWVLRLASLLRSEQRWHDLAELLSARIDALPPDSRADALTLLAEARGATGDAAASIAALGSLIESGADPDRVAQALYQRGELLTAAGRLAEANRDFARVAEQRPRHEVAPFALYALAANQLQAGDKRAAEQTLQELVDGYQQGPIGEARYMLANLLEQRGEHQRALRMLDGAKGPADELAYLRGLSLAGAGRADEAKAAFQSFLSTHAASALAPQVTYELAWLTRSDDPRRAAQLFEQLAAQHPDSPLAAESLLRAGELLYNAGAKAGSARPLSAAASLPTAPAEIRSQAARLLGWVRFDEKEYDAAAQAFRAQLLADDSGPQAAEGHAMVGESLFALGRHETALAAYAEAEEAGLSDADLATLAWLHAGQSAAQLGRWEESLVWLDRADKANPEGGSKNQIAYERGWAFVNLKRPNDAAPIFESLADPKNGVLGARSQFMLGEVQFGEKAYEDAVRTFFRVAYGYGGDKAPDEYHAWQAESLFEAGRCLEALGREEPARKLYLELLERFPDSAKAEHARARLQPGGTL